MRFLDSVARDFGSVQFLRITRPTSAEPPGAPGRAQRAGPAAPGCRGHVRAGRGNGGRPGLPRSVAPFCVAEHPRGPILASSHDHRAFRKWFLAGEPHSPGLWDVGQGACHFGSESSAGIPRRLVATVRGDGGAPRSSSAGSCSDGGGLAVESSWWCDCAWPGRRAAHGALWPVAAGGGRVPVPSGRVPQARGGFSGAAEGAFVARWARGRGATTRCPCSTGGRFEGSRGCVQAGGAVGRDRGTVGWEAGSGDPVRRCRR